MAEFCECGSLLIDGRCSNKSCALRVAPKAAPAGKKSRTADKSEARAANPRRASKVVTYNLYDRKEN